MRNLRLPLSIAAYGSQLGDIEFWPLGHRQLQTTLDRTQAAYLDHLADLEPAVRRVAILAGHSVVSYAAWLVELGLTAERLLQEKTGIDLPDDLTFIRGDAASIAVLGTPRFGAAPPPRYATPRRIVRMADWRSWPSAILSAFDRSGSVATGHNPLLLNALRRDRPATAYRHAETYLDEAKRRGIQPADDVVTLAETIANLLVAAAGFSGEIAEPMRRILAAGIGPALAQAAADLGTLASLARVPDCMLASTGGNWASRALGLEVMRRGGQVERYGHGGKDAFIAEPEMLSMIEGACATRFVAFTPTAADFLRNGGLPARLAPWHHLDIRSGNGNPIYRPAFSVKPRSTAQRPRALYVKAIFRGMRQLVPPLLPDAVYLTWQRRLAAALSRLNVEAVAKPHPEGLFQGKPDPIEGRMTVTYERFEGRLDWADVFIFDCADSTTFYIAACTTTPIVYLDLGLTRFAAEGRRMIERRCRILPVDFDTMNMPVVPVSGLKAAFDDLKPADPTDFRHILAG